MTERSVLAHLVHSGRATEHSSGTRGSWDRDVEGAGERFRVDFEAIDYETAIGTDIFGNEAQYPTGEGTTVGGDPTDDGGLLGAP